MPCKMSKRELARFVVSAIQTACGICLIIIGIMMKMRDDDELCFDVIFNSLVIAVFHVIAGISGVIAFNPKKVMPLNSVFLLIYVVTCVSVLIFGSPTGCYLTKTFLITKILVAYVTQLVEVLGLVLSYPDLQAYFNRTSTGAPTVVDKLGGKQYIQLPEARTHIQEAPGTGEKLTIITLPQTEKIIYAVPKENYVITKDGTYVAPPGNTYLTMFFPSYNKVQVE